MVNYTLSVFEFMKKHKQPMQYAPALVPDELALFRIGLIREELDELEAAIIKKDLVLIADALADLKYVVFGTDITYGIPCDSIFDEVHRSNMTKDIIRMEDNHLKVGKGPSYSPPKIKLLIDQAIRVGASNS